MDGYEDDDTCHSRHDFERTVADCLNCGMCEWCIERSIAAAEDADDLPGHTPDTGNPVG